MAASTRTVTLDQDEAGPAAQRQWWQTLLRQVGAVTVTGLVVAGGVLVLMLG